MAKRIIGRVLRARRGASAVGYGLLVGLIAVAIIAAVAATGTELSRLLGFAANSVGGERQDGAGGGEAPAPAALAWSGTASGLDVVASAFPLSYGDAAVLTLTNSGAQASPVLALALTGDGFRLVEGADNCSGGALPAGASCSVSVQPMAGANGPLAGTLSAGAGPSLDLSGTASGFLPQLTLPAEALTLAPRTGAVAALCTDFTVSNDGFAAATGLAWGGIAGADAAAFAPCTPAEDACGAELAPGASCVFGVQLIAVRNGDFAATATVSASGQEPAERGLAGTVGGLAAALAFDPAETLILPEAVASDPGACTVVTVANTGSGLARVTAIAMDDPAHFALCAPAAAACPALPFELAPGAAACALGVQAVGRVNGSYDSDLAVSFTDADDSSQTASLPVTSTVSGWAAQLAFASESLAVTPIAGGSGIGQCTSILLTNGGNAPATLAAPAFSGANPQAFECCTVQNVGNACGSDLAAGASCAYGFRVLADANGGFAATAALGGAELALTGGANGFAPSLDGTFGSFPGMSPGVAATAMGTVTVGGLWQDAAVTVTISPGGSAALLINGVERPSGSTVANGDLLRIRAVPRSGNGDADYALAHSLSVSIGGVSVGGLGFTTRSLNRPTIAFVDEPNAAAGETVDVARQFTVGQGFDYPFAVSLGGGSDSSARIWKNNETPGTAPVSIAAGDTLRVRLVAGAAGVTHSATVAVAGGGSDSWSVTVPAAGACGVTGTSTRNSANGVAFGTAGTYSVTVPAGVNSVMATLWGGGGGGATGGSNGPSGGGGGGYASRSFAVSPGQVLTVHVGGGGGGSGSLSGLGGTGGSGYGAGGSGGGNIYYHWPGGGGGGSSAVLSPNGVQAIAGGGGGGGGSGTGQGGTTPESCVGAAATQGGGGGGGCGLGAATTGQGGQGGANVGGAVQSGTAGGGGPGLGGSGQGGTAASTSGNWQSPAGRGGVAECHGIDGRVVITW